RAFKEAERLAGHRITVVESYRSCSEQAKAGDRICDSPAGCPGTCAPPGSSYHQLGAAIDVSERMLRDPSTMSALRRAGWCQSVPDSDPGHFSFGGCH
ncbi:MAG: D-alanyl-D-alanine carboxypeptidase family protein, partial [Actinomycetota bacterium]